MSSSLGCRSPNGEGGRDRGVALVIVMMTISLLSAMIGSLTLATITETAIAANYRDAADALHAAEAAVEFVLQEIAPEDWDELLAMPGQSAFVDGAPAGIRKVGAAIVDLTQATLDVSASAVPPAGALHLPAVLHAFGCSRTWCQAPRAAPLSMWPCGWPIGPGCRKPMEPRQASYRSWGRRLGGGAPAGRWKSSWKRPTPQRFACSRGANCDRSALSSVRPHPDKDHARILDMRYVGMGSAVAALILLSAVTASAQSLADVARQEEARRKSVAGAGKVYTNEALQPEPPPSPGSVPAAAPAPAAAAAPAAPGADAAKPADPATPKTEAEWRKRVADERDGLSRAQIFAEALQSRINVLSADFVNVDDPAQREVVAGERQKALAELDRVKAEIQTRQKTITAIQDEARRAGVPAGWVR